MERDDATREDRRGGQAMGTRRLDELEPRELDDELRNGRRRRGSAIRRKNGATIRARSREHDGDRADSAQSRATGVRGRRRVRARWRSATGFAADTLWQRESCRRGGGERR